MYAMRYFSTLFLGLIVSSLVWGQNVMTPELLWKLGRVSAVGLTKDKKSVIYNVGNPDIPANKIVRSTYIIPLIGGDATLVANYSSLMEDTKISPTGQYKIFDRSVKVVKVLGSDFYPELSKSNVYIYNTLNNRHWDEWEDGNFDHVFFAPIGKEDQAIDLLKDQPFDCPLKPFGGPEDYIWHPNGKEIIYVTKKKYGKDYAVSTNTDIYSYHIETGHTKNLTEGMMGYDLSPSFNASGDMAWLSMKRDGYEADKQDIVVMSNGVKLNLTAHRDDLHVSGYKWSDDGKSIYFTAPINGTEQLFELKYKGVLNKSPLIKQVTKGDFDVTGIVGQSGNTLVVSRTDFNHATELYTVDINTGSIHQLTHVNDDVYNSIAMGKSERKFVKTTDGKQMLVWVIYPPNFDPAKKYPALFFCEGGPQSALTQFYSFRWNFQLMAANDYIIIAPSRRGMPGFGTKWNEQISKDWGGQVMRDYLSAFDALSKEKFIDKSRIAGIGASYGGYSVNYLAGIHNNRFKTFITHDGVFDLRSMYGTTEELWFVNWDIGGNYWDKKNAIAQNSYAKFSPSNLVDKWNTPILVYQGGKDYRVPIEQGLQAFQAAQMKGIKSRLVYLPDENHWVLQGQNALVWQREFYKWLKETL